MTTLGANSIANEWAHDVYAAYSAKNPVQGQPDIWKVAKISRGYIVDSVDADYIRAADTGTALKYSWNLILNGPILRGNPGFTANAPSWVKLRQFSKVRIETDGANGNIGILHHESQVGFPAVALEEARKYDTGWHVMGSKEGRGAEAVKGAIREWEDIIAAGQFDPTAHARKSSLLPW